MITISLSHQQDVQIKESRNYVLFFHMTSEMGMPGHMGQTLLTKYCCDAAALLARGALDIVLALHKRFPQVGKQEQNTANIAVLLQRCRRERPWTLHLL